MGRDDYNAGYADGVLAAREMDMSDRVYLAALAKYGNENQMYAAIGALSGLMRAVANQICGTEESEDLTDLTEKMADVYIFLRQLEIVFGNDSDIELSIAEKTARLKAMVEDDGK